MQRYFVTSEFILAFVLLTVSHLVVSVQATDICNYCMNDTCTITVDILRFGAGDTSWIYIAGNITVQTSYYSLLTPNKWYYSVQTPLNTNDCPPALTGNVMCSVKFEDPDEIDAFYTLPEGQVLVVGLQCNNFIESCEMWMNAFAPAVASTVTEGCNLIAN